MKRQRVDVTVSAEPQSRGLTAAGTKALGWDPNEDANTVLDACARIAAGNASVADLNEMLRLSNGAMQAPTARARSGASFCETLAESYRVLWSALASDPKALEAVLQLSSVHKGSEWPPTFVQVQEAYAAVAPNAEDRLKAFDKYALQNELDAAQYMVTILGNEVRKRFAALPTEWEPLVDRYAGTDALDECDRGRHYFILETDRGNEIEMLLLVEKSPDGQVVDVGDVTVPSGPLQITVSKESGIHVVNAYNHSEPRTKYLPGDVSDSMAMLFLAALPTQLGATGTIMDPPPAGLTQVRQAMVDVDKYSRLPDNVRDHLKRRWNKSEWSIYPMRAVWLNACQLTIALRLFQGQLYARTFKEENQPFQQTLASMAAMAHQGEFPRGLLLPEAPEQLRHRAAAQVWQTTCAAPASMPLGRLSGAGRLIDVARIFDIAPTQAQLEMPELLCSDLAHYTKWVPTDESESESESETMDDAM